MTEQAVHQILQQTPLPDGVGLDAGEPGQQLAAAVAERHRIAGQEVVAAFAQADAEVVRRLDEQAVRIDELEAAAPGVLQRVPAMSVAVTQNGSLGIEGDASLV